MARKPPTEIGDFARRLAMFCASNHASVTSWLRSSSHNMNVGGVPGSAHRFGLGADVVYDVLPPLEHAALDARHLGLKLIREDGHDHLQPANWPAG